MTAHRQRSKLGLLNTLPAMIPFEQAAHDISRKVRAAHPPSHCPQLSRPLLGNLEERPMRLWGQVLDRRAETFGQHVGDDQAMAALVIALQAQQADA